MGEIQNDLREIQMVGAQTQQQIVAPSAANILSTHGILLAGVSEAREGFHWVRTSPSIGVVLSCFYGQGHVLVDRQWHVCAAGTAYVTPAHTLHAYRVLHDGAWGLSWVIYRETDMPFATSAPILVHGDAQALRSAVLGLYRESIGPSEPSFLHHWAELVHLEALRMTNGTYRERRLWRLWEVVDADLAHHWTLQELAALACVSAEHLRYLCQRELERSPMHHVAQLRMQRAAVLLRFTDDTIEAIAHAVGYENPYAFSTAFKRFSGVPPSQYRMLHAHT